VPKQVIQSLTNPKVIHIKKLLHSAAYRREKEQYVVEGKKCVIDHIKHNANNILTVFQTVERPLLSDDYDISSTLFLLETKILKNISSLKNSSGYLAIVKQQKYNPTQIFPKIKKAFLVDQIQNPSNLGALVRNAVAFNIDAVIYTAGTVDPYHPESIRAMAGNSYQVPILECNLSLLDKLQEMKFNFYVLAANGQLSLKKLVIKQKSVFIFGSEGRGVISNELSNLNAMTVSIEMNKQLESLNVSVASGIVGYLLGFNQ